MAGRGDRLLQKFAEALALGMSATEAAKAAGYPRGKSEKKPMLADARAPSVSRQWSPNCKSR
jgi:hypothetical protein